MVHRRYHGGLTRVKHLLKIIKREVLPGILEQAQEFEDDEPVMEDMIEDLEATVINYANYFVSGGGRVDTIERAEQVFDPDR